MAKTKEKDLNEGTPGDGCSDRYAHRPRLGYGSEAGDVPILFEMNVNSPNEPVPDLGKILQDNEEPPVVVLCEDPNGFQAGHVYYVNEEVARRWTSQRVGNIGVYRAARRLKGTEDDVQYIEDNSRAARVAARQKAGEE